MWNCDDFDWVGKSALGRVRGWLIIWSSKCFELHDSFQKGHFLGMAGLWGGEKEVVVIVNVHAPCDLRAKKLMWEELIAIKQARGGERWCVVGDFNVVLSDYQRKGVEDHGRGEEMVAFGEFIAEANLVDILLRGRKYTWYKANGTSMSRLDRFLLFELWLSTWNNLSQWGLPRTVSDHCAVILKEKVNNLGPKPFQVLNCWRKVEGFGDFVRSS